MICSCGDELPTEGAGLRSPANKNGVGVAPLQGLAAWVPGLPLVLACDACSPLGCPSSPEDDREELADGVTEFPGVPGVLGACTAGSEELLGTVGGSRGSTLAVWLELSEDRLSTLRAGDGVAEGGSECDRREAWRAVQRSRPATSSERQDFCPDPTHPAPRVVGSPGHEALPPSGWSRGQRTPNPCQDPCHKGTDPLDPILMV